MSAVRSSGRLLFARSPVGAAALPCISVTGSRRQYADDVKFLKTLDPAHMKRGRGGRSSFSGTVCTVFGATGFMGRYVVNKLGKTGTQMVLPYRGDFYDAMRLKVAGDLGQVLFCPYHLCDEESIAKAVRHSNAVVNLVGRDYTTRNFNMEQVHVEGAARIARICKKMGVERFIHVSALNSDRHHEGSVITGGSAFLAAKGVGEKAVLAEFPDATIIRPSDIYGSEDRFLRYYAFYHRTDKDKMSLPGGGYNIFKQPVYVVDVAQGIVNAVLKDIDTKGQIYQAVGPRRYELRDLVEWFLRVLRRDPTIQGGISVVNMKYYPMPIVKAKFNELFPWSPLNAQTMDKLERESVTDIVSSNLPTLEDLGVSTLVKLEDRVEWELRPYREFEYYDEEIGDFDPPAPPKFVQV
uniref:NADH dehydrogenase [ubiquinone] 1 alpha subcomplex subunit 9, mitochondrial n=1 Tax=Hirondellea gigas TaxID=1518452 RepID=A0A2P2I108_9CRUS